MDIVDTTLPGATSQAFRKNCILLCYTNDYVYGHVHIHMINCSNMSIDVDSVLVSLGNIGSNIQS